MNDLGLDETSEEFLHGRAQIILVANLLAGLSQHFDGFGKFQPKRRIEKSERLRWVLFVDRRYLLRAPLFFTTN